jgi:prefoldin subunit 5
MVGANAILAAMKDKAMIDMFKAFSELYTNQINSMRDKLDTLDVKDSEVRELRELLIEAKRNDNEQGVLSPVLEARVNKVLNLIENVFIASLTDGTPKT